MNTAYHIQLIGLITGVTFSLFGSYLDKPHTVMVIVPLTDGVRSPVQKLDHQRTVDALYESIPFSPEVGPNSCPRARQFLFNEVGTILETTLDGAEALVEFPHIFHEDASGKQSIFWLPAKNIAHLHRLKENLGTLSWLPEPICYAHPEDPCRFENVLTLILPWENSTTHTAYSAGTRFKRVRDLDTAQSYAIQLYNHEKGIIEKAFVDKNLALVAYPKEYASAKKLFVTILRKWAQLEPHKIAYTWGGCSFIETYCPNLYNRVPGKRGDDVLEYWERPHALIPHSGLDCSGLIFRAAQIAGLPYYFSNTTTLSLHLRDVKDNEMLEEGDLIFFKGHVIAVTSLKENKVVEAVGYSAGYGNVHEISLHELCDNVDTFDALCSTCKSQAPLRIKNKKGVVTKVVDSFRLLKMADAPSLWH